MTCESAYRLLTEFSPKAECDGCTENCACCAYSEALDIAVNSLIQQIPLKTKLKEKSKYRICAVCGEVLIAPDKFCCSCGRKIDWTKDEDDKAAKGMLR